MRNPNAITGTGPEVEHAERWLIASMALRPGDVPEIATTVNADEFHNARYADWYRLLRDNHGATTNELKVIAGHHSLDLGEVLAWCEEFVSGVNWPYPAKVVKANARVRLLRDVAAQITHESQDNDGDADALFARSFEAVAHVCGSEPQGGDTPLEAAMAGALDRLHSRGITRYDTGLTALDRLTGGIWARGINTFLGVPSSGKTSLILGIVSRVAVQYKVGVRVFSYEMDSDSIAGNLLAQWSGVPVSTLARKRTPPNSDEQDRMGRAIEHMRDRNVAIVDDHLNSDEIVSRCRWYAGQGVGLVVLDYVQHLPPINARISQVENIGYTMSCLRRIVRECGIGVVAVSQITKDQARQPRPPTMMDGFGSATIEQYSDMMFGVYRPAVWESSAGYAPDAWRERLSESYVNVMKDKRGSPCNVQVRFTPETSSFHDYEPEPDFKRNGSNGFASAWKGGFND